MDDCSWVPSQAARGRDRAVFSGDDMPWHNTSNSSCHSDQHIHREREDQDVVISPQLQQQLKQIYMLLDMELEHDLQLLHHAVPPQSPSIQQHGYSSSSSPFRSCPAVSSDDTSSLVITASSTNTTTFSQQQQQQQQQQAQAEASYLDTPFSPLPYNLSDTTIPNLEGIMSMNQARHKDDGHADSAGTSAFRQYVQHLRPKNKLKEGACGQKRIKTAMSFLAKMHSANMLAEWQRQSSSWQAASEATTAVPTSGESMSNDIQLQHVLSERKRREKINQGFYALKDALPPSSKRDKTSILLRARDYINSLKSRVSELEEKNRMAESQLGIDYGDEQDINGSRENTEVHISSRARMIA